MKPSFVRTAGVCLLLSLAGCDEPPPTPVAGTAEGLWSGSTSSGRTLTAAVLDDGTYYVFYSAVANPNQLSGVIHGTGTSDDGTFTSVNTKDIGIGASVLDATFAATYRGRQFFNGTIAYAGGTVTFTSAYTSAYDTAPALGVLAGVYQVQAGRSGGADLATITVAAAGTFTGSEQNGCTFIGSMSPRRRGNLFDYSVTFAGAPCVFAGTTLQGIWYFDLTTRRLFAAAPTSSRTDAVIWFGTKVI